jgi:hypothetical protein
VEREAAERLFKPFTRLLEVAEFSDVECHSNKQKKSLESRRSAFQAIKTSAKQGRPPTLGQMLFLLPFWSDPLMDSCTDYFKKVRNQMKPTSVETISKLSALFRQPLGPSRDNLCLADLRNSAAHPRELEELDWQSYAQWLREALGEPPREILRQLAELDPNIDSGN